VERSVACALGSSSGRVAAWAVSHGRVETMPREKALTHSALSWEEAIERGKDAAAKTRVPLTRGIACSSS